MSDLDRLKGSLTTEQGYLADWERELDRAKTDAERDKWKVRVAGQRNKVQGIKDELRHTYGV